MNPEGAIDRLSSGDATTILAVALTTADEQMDDLFWTVMQIEA